MTEQECLERMVAPGTRRPGKFREGVIQICVTSRCNMSCFSCTQASNVENAGRADMTPEQFGTAVESLRGYFGVVGVFGGNPAMNKRFRDICKVFRESWVSFEQRGLWCNDPLTPENALACRETFNPRVSNLNVHLDREAYQRFKTFWPESMPFGLDRDSRHSPPWIAMRDVRKKKCENCDGAGHTNLRRDLQSGDPLWEEYMCPDCKGEGEVYDESLAWDLISRCDINQHWSAMIGVFRGELRAWFCEVAGAQAMLHQHEPDYPDTGARVVLNNLYNDWWKKPMSYFADQVRHHCHSCGVPMRGFGQLAQDRNPETAEQVSGTHASVYKPKDRRRPLQLVTERSQVREQALDVSTHYLQNAEKR